MRHIGPVTLDLSDDSGAAWRGRINSQADHSTRPAATSNEFAALVLGFFGGYYGRM